MEHRIMKTKPEPIITISLSISDAILAAHSLVGAVTYLDRDIEEEENNGNSKRLDTMREAAASLDRLSTLIFVSVAKSETDRIVSPDNLQLDENIA